MLHILTTHNLRLHPGSQAFCLMRCSAEALSELQSAADGRHGPTHDPKSAFRSQCQQDAKTQVDSNIHYNLCLRSNNAVPKKANFPSPHLLLCRQRQQANLPVSLQVFCVRAALYHTYNTSLSNTACAIPDTEQYGTLPHKMLNQQNSPHYA